jgi:hypothetical protein
MLKKNRLLTRIKALFPRIPPSAPDSSSQTPAETPDSGASIKDAARMVKMGFSYRREMVTPLGKAPPPLPENAYTSPLTVAGTAIGEIQAAAEEKTWTGRETEIIDGVAAQLARHLENLRREERDEKSA